MQLRNLIIQIIDRGIWFNLGHIFIIAATSSIGMLAYKRNKEALSNRYFLLVNMGFALFAVSMFMADFIFLPHNTLLLIVRLSFVAGALMTLFIFRFCQVFPDEDKTVPIYFKITLLLYPIFIYLLLSDLVIKDISINKNSSPALTAEYGPLYFLVFLVFVFLAFTPSMILYLKSKKYKGKKRAQVQLVMLGLFLFSVSITFTNLIPQVLGGIGLSRFGALGVFFFVGFTAYAIAKHRLMGIRMIVIKTITHALTLSLIIALFFSLTYVISAKYRGLVDTNVLNISIFIVLLVIYSPVRKNLENFSDKYFFKQAYNFNDLLLKINNIVTQNSRSIANLTGGIMNTLMKDMNVSKSAFVIVSVAGVGNITSSGFSNKSIGLLTKPVTLGSTAKKTLVREELPKDSKDRLILSKIQAEVLVPIKTEGQIEAVLALGEKQSGDMYNSQDLQLLELAAPQIAIAMENARLYEQAITDSLTGLYHHRYFTMRLEKELERAKRYKYPLSIVMLDIDYFKKVNDIHGHQIGDEVLIEMAQLLTNNVRNCDIVCRYGGEEFMILMPVMNKKMMSEYQEIIFSMVNRLKAKIQENEFTEKKIRLTMSLGVLMVSNNKLSSQELIEKVDTLLYKAKDGGRNTICEEILI